MELRDLKKGDKIYATFNSSGFLGYGRIYECLVTKVVTKDFVTIVYLDDLGSSVGKKAVGYYRGNCALNDCYLFSSSKEALEKSSRVNDNSDRYNYIIAARDRIMKFIKEGK